MEHQRISKYSIPSVSISMECYKCITFPHWGGRGGKWKCLQDSAQVGIFEKRDISWWIKTRSKKKYTFKLLWNRKSFFHSSVFLLYQLIWKYLMFYYSMVWGSKEKFLFRHLANSNSSLRGLILLPIKSIIKPLYYSGLWNIPKAPNWVL